MDFKSIGTICLFLFISNLLLAQFTKDIRVNQLGYFESGEKIASVKTKAPGTYEIKSIARDTTFHSGTFDLPKNWTYSNEAISNIDFSFFRLPGNYVIEIDGKYSYPFQIYSKVALEALRSSLKAFYFNRCSSSVIAEYGDPWIRALGHPDVDAEIHESASSMNFPTGTKLNSSKGWYDAGDYNKYIVNSGISTYTLLAAYEQYSQLFDTLQTNIPESSNSWPDILDEVKWNLDWMLTMQDEFDGGVHHKLSNANFDQQVMPDQAQATPRFIVQKSTAASLDFAAVMATASRIYEDFDVAFSKQCMDAAEKAWKWALANPKAYYVQRKLNEKYTPPIETGEYGDTSLIDEFNWAATELFIGTGKVAYYDSIAWDSSAWGKVPNWSQVQYLAAYSIIQNRASLPSIPAQDSQYLADILLYKANNLIEYYYLNSAHKLTMGEDTSDFIWGSNAVAANQGILLLKAYQLTGNIDYINTAMGAFDYIFGRNAVNMSFVTGFGSDSPLHPHHRISEADTILDPIPGMLVGGPQNKYNQDSCLYEKTYPASQYIDDNCSYTTNEVAINWNAPLVFLLAGLQNYYLASDYTELNPLPNAVNNLYVLSLPEGKCMLSWQDQSTDEHSFLIQASKQDSTIFEEYANVPVNVTKFTDTIISYGDTINYRVRSSNFIGHSPASKTIQVQNRPIQVVNSDSTVTMPDSIRIHSLKNPISYTYYVKQSNSIDHIEIINVNIMAAKKQEPYIGIASLQGKDNFQLYFAEEKAHIEYHVTDEKKRQIIPIKILKNQSAVNLTKLRPGHTYTITLKADQEEIKIILENPRLIE